MKKHFIIIALMIVSIAGMSFTNSNETDLNNPTRKNSKCIQSNAWMKNNFVNFSIVMQNDAEDGYYSLKKKFDDGKFETVEYQQIQKGRSLKTYDFQDEKVPTESCTYILMRIIPETKEFKVIRKWNFQAEVKSIEPSEDLLVNIK